MPPLMNVPVGPRECRYSCGEEAICHTFSNGMSKCVCPHDLSEPTLELSCLEPVNDGIRQYDDADVGSNLDAKIGECDDNVHICGREAICNQIQISTYECICHYSLSDRTPDFRCPNHLIDKGSNLDAKIGRCDANIYTCGKKAYCKQIQIGLYNCTCPNTLSKLTPYLKCRNRQLVPLTPRPIQNITPPNGNNGTISTNALPEAEQVEGSKHKIPEATIGVAVAIVAVVVLLLSIV